MKSAVERLPLAATKGVMLAVSIKQTNQMGRSALRRIRTPRVGLLEPVDGDRFSLALPLRQKLVEQVVVLTIGDAEATAFLPQKQLLRSCQKGVSQVELERPSVGVSIGNGVDDGVTGHLVGPVLNHVAKHQRLIITQQAFVNIGLDGAGDFLEGVLAVRALYLLEMTTRSAGHARADHRLLWALPVIQRIGDIPLNYPL